MSESPTLPEFEDIFVSHVSQSSEARAQTWRIVFPRTWLAGAFFYTVTVKVLCITFAFVFGALLVTLPNGPIFLATWRAPVFDVLVVLGCAALPVLAPILYLTVINRDYGTANFFTLDPQGIRVVTPYAEHRYTWAACREAPLPRMLQLLTAYVAESPPLPFTPENIGNTLRTHWTGAMVQAPPPSRLVFPADMRRAAISARQLEEVLLRQWKKTARYYACVVAIWSYAVGSVFIGVFNPAFIVYCAFFWLISYVLADASARRQMRASATNPLFTEPAWYGFDAEAWHIRRKTSESHIRWEYWQSWAEHEHTIAMYHNNQAYLWPKAPWSETELAALRDILRSRVGKKLAVSSSIS